MTVLNWCYGADEPVENANLVNDQIWLAHKYRNRLIELELIRRKSAETDARALHPEFDAAAKVYDAAESAVDAAYDLLRRERVKARKRIEPTAETQSIIDAAKKDRVAAGEALKEHKAEAYRKLSDSQLPYREIAAATAEIPPDATPITRKKIINDLYLQMLFDAGLSGGEYEYARDQKAARATSGLYWGTYLVIEDAAKDYRKGAPPKFRRFDGFGSIAVQLIGGLSAADAVACEDTRLQLQLPEITERMATKGKDYGKQARGEARLRVGSDANRKPIWAVVPFVYHRPIPADAVIKWAFLDRVRVGQAYQWKLRLTLQTAASHRVPANNNDMAGVHVGHRMMPDGMRVATVMHATTDGQIQTRELIIPREELATFQIAAGLDAIRENTANVVADEFVAWLDQIEPSEWMASQTETIAHWKGPERLNQLATRWRHNRFALDEMSSEVMPHSLAWAQAKLAEYSQQSHYQPLHAADLTTVFGLMDFWRKFDKHLCEWAANQSRKCIARRENLYRTFVAELHRKFGAVAIAKIDWKKLRESPDMTEEDENGVQVRRLASIGSPGRLSEIIAEVFGDKCYKVTGKDVTLICHHCEKPNNFDRLQVRTTCQNCLTEYDQDHNACRNTLSRGDVMRREKTENAGGNGREKSEEKTPRKSRRNRKSA